MCRAGTPTESIFGGVQLDSSAIAANIESSSKKQAAVLSCYGKFLERQYETTVGVNFG